MMKVYLLFKSFRKDRLQDQLMEVVSLANELGLCISGAVPLPLHRQRFTLNRSPHIYKKSREQFEITTHSRLVVVLVQSVAITTLFVSMVEDTLVGGVGFKVKVIT